MWKQYRFHKQPSVNPYTNRPIRIGGPTYQELAAKFGDPIKPRRKQLYVQVIPPIIEKKNLSVPIQLIDNNVIGYVTYHPGDTPLTLGNNVIFYLHSKNIIVSSLDQITIEKIKGSVNRTGIKCNWPWDPKEFFDDDWYNNPMITIISSKS